MLSEYSFFGRKTKSYYSEYSKAACFNVTSYVFIYIFIYLSIIYLYIYLYLSFHLVS